MGLDKRAPLHRCYRISGQVYKLDESHALWFFVIPVGITSVHSSLDQLLDKRRNYGKIECFTVDKLPNL